MTSSGGAATIALVLDSQAGSLSAAAKHGLARLTAVLEGRGWRVRRESIEHAAAEPEITLAFVVASMPAAGALSRRLAAEAGVAPPTAPESLVLARLPDTGGRPPLVLILGGDSRGLAYALLEAARRVELADIGSSGAGPQALLDLFLPLAEAPERRLRSVCMFPHHAALDAEWYRSLDFWRWYFDLLALHRFNRFTLTFGHQTAYLTPPYPYFIAVPAYAEVSVLGLSEAARQANLDLLRAIGRLAIERGLDFALGVWSQQASSYGPSAVVGLRPENLAGYCAAGLQRLLETCPEISAVQLRVNSESGVHLDEGARFWRAIFAGIAACGRRITLDLRAKGIVDDTIEAGLATGLPVIVNTKFWTEHHGLPYHPTLLQQGDRYVRRHSYGDQLRYPGGRPRPYDLLFQLWNLGTNRLLLWADPEWVRHFASASTLGGAAGFEVCAPLSNKGFGNRGEVWRLFADSSYEFYRWEQERYWYWYLLFGRLGYNGQADPNVWRREWAARLGAEAAPHVERALQAASKVLPLLTACHSPSASVFGYWPEKDMGGLLDLYLQVEGSDVAMFASAQEAVEERLYWTLSARRPPGQSSLVFAKLADHAEAALAAALSAAAPETDQGRRELRGVALDVRVQAQLARYHAAKLQAAEHLAWFYATGDLDSLRAARPAAQQALEAWRCVVKLTDGVYHHDLIFGRPNDQDGHWKDHLLYAEHDVARLDEVERLFHRYELFDLGFDFGAQLPPRTGTPPLPYLHDYSVERRFIGVGPHTLYSPQAGYGWGSTYGLVATGAPQLEGKTLRAAAPRPERLPHEALYCDFVHRHSAAPYDNATFVVDLPNGDYEVTVILADRSLQPVDHGPMVIRLQGRHEFGPVHVPAGEIIEWRQRVCITNGRLDMEVSAPPQGDWLLTGLVITRMAPHIGHRPPARARPGAALHVRGTVTGPEPVARVAVRYRFDAQAPYATLPLQPVAEAGTVGRPIRFAAALDVPEEATLIEYFLEATDVQGTTSTWPAKGAAGPRRLYAGGTTPPRIGHQPVRQVSPGQPVTIRARITASAPLAHVTLFYRNVNQMQTHDRLEMVPVEPGEQDDRDTQGERALGSGKYTPGSTELARPGAGGETQDRTKSGGHAPGSVEPGGQWSGVFQATIPASAVSPEWDLMYHLEAVDALGNASFAPGLDADTPYIVVSVARPL